MRQVRLYLMAILTIAVLAGCSNPPDEAERMANEAMNAAEQVKAAKYAADQWQMAEDTLQAARTEKAAQDDRFALFRSYGDAEKLFNSSTSLAHDALTEAQAQLTMVKQEVEQMMTQASATVDTLSTLVTKIKPRKDTKAEIEVLKQDLAAFQNQIRDAQGSYDDGDYDLANTKIRAIMEPLQSLDGQIRKAAGAAGKRGSA